MNKIKLVLFALSLTSLQAEGLKKVLILDFINIEKNANFQYLETSITDSVTEMLRKRFAFTESDKGKTESVATENFLFRDDYYTKSTAMNLGLLTRQDIVICGGFRIVKKKGDRIITQVRILDLQRKKAIAEFEVEGPADASIFESTEKLANRVADEAKTVLPNKDDFQKKGISSTGSTVFFDKFTMGVRAGGIYMHSGFNQSFVAQQPMLGLLAKVNIPAIWQHLGFEVNFTYFRHNLKSGDATVAQALGLSGVTTNYLPTGRFFVDFPLGKNLTLSAAIGGGYVMQTTTVTSTTTITFNNGFPCVAGGFDLAYSLGSQFSLVFGLNSFFELEKNAYSFVHAASLGANYRL